MTSYADFKKELKTKAGDMETKIQDREWREFTGEDEKATMNLKKMIDDVNWKTKEDRVLFDRLPLTDVQKQEFLLELLRP